MNGKIWVESEYGIGSNFIFEIELIEERDKSIEQFKKFNHKKVLIVDDNHTWHEILRNSLELFDVKVESAYSGSEALELLKECNNHYDVILMDWQMPELNGIETIKQLKKDCELCSIRNLCNTTLPNTVVMVSSYRQESIVEEAKDLGINIFLQKPINPSLLNDILSGIFLNEITESFTQTTTKISLQNDIPSLNGSQILLVEDNETNQEIIIGLLENSGIKIDIAQNGVEAVELYTNNKDKYELILMDLQMPIMDGYEATKQIRDKDKNIPIIALTANAMKEDVQKTKAIGMNDHLNKPIDVEKLYEALLKYISKKEDIKISNKNDVNEVITSEFDFKYINSKIGLGHLIGNSKLYIKILEKFFDDYKELNLDKLDKETYKRVLHTIKGISATIGAMQLHNISKELEKSYDKDLIIEFKNELELIINELDIFFTLNKSNNKENNSIEKPEIEQEKRDILLNNLYESADMMELEQCQKILEKLSLYKLNDNDNKIFEKSKIAIEEYDFDEIIEMLEK